MKDDNPDRFHKEPKSKFRSEFQRDRDRVLYTNALRRLASITQVVSAEEGHVFHNRFSHTLKTAQVAVRIAEYLRSKQEKQLEQYIREDPGYAVDSDVVEAAALAHDLGHPPFGHIAEEVLDEEMRDKADEDGFEGNAQSFRVVTKLTIRHADHRGINLTRRTLNAILKYPWGYSADHLHGRKWGFYSTERAEFNWARKHFQEKSVKTVEAEIMDWADDITYSVHDLEDFYRAGMLPLDELCQDPIRIESFVDEVYERRKQEDNELPLEKGEALEALTDLLKYAGLSIRRPFDGSRMSRTVLREFTSELIGRYVLGRAKKSKGPRVPPFRLAAPGGASRIEIEPAAKHEVLLLKELVVHFVFNRSSLVGQQHGHREVIKVLFRKFYDATGVDVRQRSILPLATQEYLRELLESKEKHDRETARCRIAADSVAGLTERQAVALFRRFTGHDGGTVFDPVVR